MGAAASPGVSLPGGIKLPDRYIVHRRIATGGMASVWCAEDRTLGRPVAIKLLSEPYVHDAGTVLRFKREARAAARLSSHPNVVTIYDVGESTAGPDDETGRAFIVMAYLEGGTVAGALRRGPVELIEALRWMGEAAAGLDYAHERGVVHRDIKPENLLLDSGRVIHVADFGIARITTETPITQSGQVFGTAAYLAPERTLGEPATEASDRYSLAVVAFELLVGQRPFESEAVAAQLRQHAEETAPSASQLNPTLPPAVDAVLARGMAKQQLDRWPTAASFAATLADAAKRRAPDTATRPLPIGIPGQRSGAGNANGGSRRAPAFAAAGASDRRRAAAPRPVPAAAGPPPRGMLPARTIVRRRTAGRVLALLTLAAVLLGAALVVFADRGTPPPASTVARKKGVTRTHSQQRANATPSSTATTTPASTTPSSPPSSSATTGSVSSASTGTPTGSFSAGAREAQGHELMLAGNYAAAIPVLRQAVAASHENPTYAYALYDLGRSLVLAGDPSAAIPILRARMQIPIERATVAAELAAAERAAGVAQPSSASPTPPSSASGGDHGGNGQGNGQGGN
ncbi:MAG TPA: protein kinase [Solirubrobacteraceae bacterium]